VAIGLIAGNGTFPFLVLREARRLGHDVVVIALEGEAFPALESAARGLGGVSFSWIPIGELARCIAILKGAGVTQAVMAGQVKHVKLYGGVRPDAALGEILSGLGTRNTDALIAGVVKALNDHGITLMDSTSLLADLLAKAGVLTGRQPGDDMRGDFEYGYRVADTLAGADIGQTAIVKARAVVALEAMEGTDAAIARAGALAGPGTRVIKVAKPAQDMRFDVPVVGVATIKAMVAAGADGLSIDAGKTLIVDGDAFVRAADEAGVVVVGRPR
jgi:DUF1009 family protein